MQKTEMRFLSLTAQNSTQDGSKTLRPKILKLLEENVGKHFKILVQAMIF
jgi:hypothetical protein